MSLPRYTQYQDCAFPELGDLPASWQAFALKRELAFLTSGSRGWADHYSDEGDLFIRITNLTRGSIALDLRDLQFVAVPEGAEGERTRVRPGDVLFSITAYIGSVAVVPQSIGKAYVSQHIALARLRNERLLPEWIGYFVLSSAGQRLLDSAGYGGTKVQLSLDDIANLPVPVPPAADQRSVVAFLDRETAKIDSLIAEQEKLLALLAEKRQATISHAVTRGLNPNAPMKDSGIPWLGEVPAHWDVTRLKFIATVQTGIAKGKDTSGKETITVPYLRVANVQEGHLALDDVATIDIEPEQLERYLLRRGDVLMNEGGDFDKLGRGALWDGQIKDCIHQNHVFAVRPHAIAPRWLNQVSGSQYAQFYFMGRSKQSTNLASISSTNIMELPVVLPPDDEQEEILLFVEQQSVKNDALKKAADDAIALLKERRSALISAAVTGKIDVRQDA